MAQAERVPEIALSAAWHAGRISDELITVDGETVRVIHRGTWTHGLGPDFADALLLFGERELRSGAVEMHLETHGWSAHGHHGDPAYDTVILHVVARHDGSPARRSDGALVPVVEVGLPDIAHLPLAVLDWDRVGGTMCASQLAQTSPSTLRTILQTLGDTRLSARSAQIEVTLLEAPPAEALWRAILSGLGYSRNQRPMRRLSELIPLATLDELCRTQPSTMRFHLLLGLLLGASGFLPLSPGEAHLIKLRPEDVAAVERAWQSAGSPWHSEVLLAEEWDRARTRPANHPLPRLHAAAAIALNSAPSGGVLPATVAILQSGDPIAGLRELSRSHEMPGIGDDRTVEILASSVFPVLFAIASHTEDDLLAEMTSRVWEKLPAPAATSVTKRALRQVCGNSPLRGIGARGAQGLVHLDTALCQPRRCFECPIAAAELLVNE